MNLLTRIAQRAKDIRGAIDAGMTTAEYAVGTVVPRCLVLDGDGVRQLHDLAKNPKVACLRTLAVQDHHARACDNRSNRLLDGRRGCVQLYRSNRSLVRVQWTAGTRT